MQSSTYVIPYPDRGFHQWQYQWWIIEFEFFIFCITAVCTLKPASIPRMKVVCLALLASALPLVMDNINAFWFLLRDYTANSHWHYHRIACALSGFMMLGIGNMWTLICMGAYQHTSGSNA